jgi:transcriptional regulator with PAS, ATPase and Fis domain
MAAAGDAPVLITGETGTGKTMLARYIHARCPHPEAPFVALNTAALPKELVESELFGHERGAFTGADRRRRGLFEMAHGGTLLLDEIGSLAVELQAKLLSVLEDGAVRRIGGEAVRPVRVRIVAATNSDLLAAVRRRQFREDLYYRLDVLHIHLPPLRERRRDIGPLCRQMLANLSGGRSAAVSDDEVRRLEAYDWPGNVRELRNVLQRALTLQPGPELRPTALLEQVRPAPPVDPPSDRPALGSLVALEEIERRHVLTVLDRLGHNLARTSRVLGLSESTLRRKLQAWGAR